MQVQNISFMAFRGPKALIDRLPGSLVWCANPSSGRAADEARQRLPHRYPTSAMPGEYSEMGHSRQPGEGMLLSPSFRYEKS
jgi:hypothetical protein